MSKKIIGEKGRGFKTIFSVCDQAEIYSGNYCFKLTENSFCPEWIEKPDEEIGKPGEESGSNGTTIILHFKDTITQKEETDSDGRRVVKETRYDNVLKDADLFDKIVENYGVKGGSISYESMLQKCPIFFTNNIRRLTICQTETRKKLKISRNDEEGSVSYEWVNGNEESYPYEMKYLRAEKETTFSFDEYLTRYKDVFEEKDDFDKADSSVKSYSSVAILPLLSDDELKKIKQGKLYSYLPTDINIRVPMAIQIPFELNEDRSCMFIEGMKGNEHTKNDYTTSYPGNRTTKWNQKLFDSVFVYSYSENENDHCLLQLAYEKIKVYKSKDDVQKRILQFLPRYTQEHEFFVSARNVDSKGTALDAADKINRFAKKYGKDTIYQCYRNIKLFRSLCEEDVWLFLEDDPIMFDRTVTGIIQSCIKKGTEEETPDKLEELLVLFEKGNVGKRHLILYPGDVPENDLFNFGLVPEKVSDDKQKTDFTNILLDMNYDLVLDEILKAKDRSPYIASCECPELNIIKMDKEGENRWPIGEKEKRVWIEGNEELAEKYKSNDDLAIFVPEWNEKLVFKDKKDNSVIDNSECINNTIACRYVSWKENVPETLKDIWDKWKEDKITQTCSDLAGFEQERTSESFSYEQIIGLIEVLRVLSRSDKTDWYSFFTESLEGGLFSDIFKEVYDAWVKGVGVYTCHRNQSQAYPNRNYDELRESAKKMDRQDAESGGMTHLEKVETLGILLHDKFGSGKEYTLLPFNKWTDTIYKQINKVKVDNGRALFVLAQNENGWLGKNTTETDKDILDKFDVLKKAAVETGLPKKAIVYKCKFARNSDQEYVRFADKDNLFVIFNEDKCGNEKAFAKCADNCISNLYTGLSLLSDVTGKKEALRKSDTVKRYVDVEENLKTLRDICALHAKFSIDKRNKTGSNHDIWNELLQNANDHIPPDLADDRKVMIIHIGKDDDGTFLELQYPDNGFSVRDYVAICTSGNSGNEGTDENREGHKGTGFKSVYNLFDKVTIQSGDIECVLEDVEKSIEITNEKVVVKPKEGASQSEHYFPIPEFKKLDELKEETTCIRFRLKEGREIKEIKDMIFGNPKDDSQSLTERFAEQKAFLFLDNISSFSFQVDDENYSDDFDRLKYLQNYFIKERTIDISGLNPEGTHWKKNIPEENFIKERTIDISDLKPEDTHWEKNIPEKKRKVKFLFPKEYLDSEEIQDGEKPVYCTLPIQNFKKPVPFYCNIPLLELGDDRKSLQDNLKDWNKSVLQRVFEALAEIFNKYEREPENGNEKDDNLNLTNLYRYFPYSYLDNKVYDDLGVGDSLKKVKFLRAITKNGNDEKPVVSACSLNDVTNTDGVNQSYKCMLPDYMYWWFGKQGGLDGYTGSEPFLYYDGITIDDRDQVHGGHVTINDMLRTQVLDVSMDIPSYIFEKAGKISELQDGENKKKDTEIFESLLKKIFDNHCYGYQNRSLYRQSVFRAFIVCHLGTQPKSYHCLNVDWKSNEYLENSLIKIDGYENIAGKVKELRQHFGSGNNDLLLLQDEDINYLKSGFPDLLEEPYYVYSRNPWTEEVSQKQLRSIEDLRGIVKKLDKYWNYLLKESDNVLAESAKVPGDSETIDKLKSWISQGLLFGKTNNDSIIPLNGNVYVSSLRFSLDRDIIVKEAESEEVKSFFGKLLGYRYLDEGIKNKEFYSNLDEVDFAKAVLGAYLSSDYFSPEFKNEVKYALQTYLAENTSASLNEEKRSELFKFMLEINGSEGLEWKDGYKKYISYCEQKDFNKPIFSIVSNDNNNNDVVELGEEIKIRFNDKVSDKTREGEKRIWDGSNICKKLEEIVEKHICVVNHCDTRGKHLYCRARKDEKDVIILFAESAFGNVLRDLYDCREYGEAIPYETMECLPSDMLTGWRSYDLKNDEILKIQNYVKTIWNEIKGDKEHYKERLISSLISPFVYRIRDENNNANPRLIEARGYGGEQFGEKRCPICDSLLLSERSILNVRNIIAYRPDKDHLIYLPILCCKNCNESYRYANDIRWEPQDALAELSLGKIDSTELLPVDITFEFPNETKKIPVKLTYLLRIIWSIEIGDKPIAN